MRKMLMRVLAPAACLGILGAHAAPVTGAESIETVSVDCSVMQGMLPRIERFNNVADWDAFPNERKSDVQFYNSEGLHGELYRVWISVDEIYDPSSKKYDYSKYAGYLADVSEITESLMVNVSARGLTGGWGLPPEQCRLILSRIFVDLKRAFPKIKYIEALNEPDYKKNFTPTSYYGYYKVFYEAVNDANKALQPAVPLQVGGPVTAQFDLTWMRAFLDGYKNDPSPGKRIDFISYHAYFVKPATTYVFFKNNPSLVKVQRAQLDAELRARGIREDMPVYITETGLYPGPLFDDITTMRTDHLRQAAGMASLFYWFMESHDTHPLNWVLRHRKEGRKDQLVTRDASGKQMVYTEKLTPYGNMLLMLSKMKKMRVSAVPSGALIEGKGLYALASTDPSGVSVMLWNYQGKSSLGLNAIVRINHMPSSFDGSAIRVQTYRIDSQTSNYHADLNNCNLQKVEDTTVAPSELFETQLSLEANSLQLVVLEPTR